MSQRLEVSFNSPQCGWMSIGFHAGDQHFKTTTAHAPHERALPELMETLAELLDNDSAQNDFLVRWNRDPEEFDFVFQRSDKTVTMQIYQYPSNKREMNEREQVFAYQGDAREVGRAFWETFEHLRADIETDEFESNWHQPFPYEAYNRFKRSYEIAARIAQ